MCEQINNYFWVYGGFEQTIINSEVNVQCAIIKGAIISSAIYTYHLIWKNELWREL